MKGLPAATVGGTALLLTVLACVSPVDHHNSDGAIALLASQAILEHGTLKLDAYRDRPECAYDLDHDYRARVQEGSYYYHSFGVPVLCVPFVWVLNRLGFHMLHQEEEFFAQNLISALLCGLIFLVLYAVCRCFVGWLPGLALAAGSVAGSSLVSTVATGLWNVGFAVLFLGLALLYLLRRPEEARGGAFYATLFLLVATAFVCRPTAGFFVVALVVFFLVERRRPAAWVGGLALLLAVHFGLLLGIDRVGWLLGYYSPRKLLPGGSLVSGLAGTLISPSRGLLVFSPFVILVLVGAIVRFRRWRREGLYWLAVVWIGVQVGVMALREVWWGGHSYGPRLLAEVMVPIVLLACLLWRDLEQRASPLARRGVAGAYSVLALVAVFIHSYQGLFNRATIAWNRLPDVNQHVEYLFDWRYPQFLTSGDRLARRWREFEVRSLPTYEMGRPVPFDGEAGLFVDWFSPETDWRWSKGHDSAVVLKLGAVDPDRFYLLDLDATVLTPQSVRVSWNDAPIGSLKLGATSRRRVLGIPGEGLHPHSPNKVRFHVPRPSSTAQDRRSLGLSLRSLRLFPLSPAFAGVSFADEAYFGRGWSGAESGWRWSHGPRSDLVYPVALVDEGRDYVLSLTTGAWGSQRVRVDLNGVRLGEVVVEGSEPKPHRFDVPGQTLRPHELNAVVFHTPDATGPAAGSPPLGLRFLSLALSALAPAEGRP